jgi:hypothetical protein
MCVRGIDFTSVSTIFALDFELCGIIFDFSIIITFLAWHKYYIVESDND